MSLAEFVSNLKGAGNFKEMTNEDIEEVIDQFKEAAKRAYEATLTASRFMPVMAT